MPIHVARPCHILRCSWGSLTRVAGSRGCVGPVNLGANLRAHGVRLLESPASQASSDAVPKAAVASVDGPGSEACASLRKAWPRRPEFAAEASATLESVDGCMAWRRRWRWYPVGTWAAAISSLGSAAPSRSTQATAFDVPATATESPASSTSSAAQEESEKAVKRRSAPRRRRRAPAAASGRGSCRHEMCQACDRRLGLDHDESSIGWLPRSLAAVAGCTAASTDRNGDGGAGGDALPSA